MMHVVPRIAHKLGALVPDLNGMRRASAEAVVVGLIGQGTLVITGVLLARELGPRDRGYAALLALWPVIVSQLGELGLPNATAYFIARAPQAFPHIVGLIRSLAKRQIPVLVLCHALILAAFLIGKPMAVIGAGVVTIVSVPANMASDYGLKMLQGQQRFRTLNLLRLVYPAVLCPGLLILLAVHQTALVAAMVALTLAACASGGAFLIAALGFRPPLPLQDGSVSGRDLLRFGLQGWLGSVYVVDTFRLDQLAVGLFLSPVALGLYVVGFAFSNLPTLIAQSLAYIAYPGVAAGKDRAQRRRIMWQFFWIFATVSLAIVAALELTIAVLIPWFFGNQFAPSIGIARIALVGGLLLAARRILAETLRGAGYPVAGTLAEGVLLVVLLPALVVGGHYQGAEGVAGAVALAGLASLLVLVAFEAHAMKEQEQSTRTHAS